MKKRLHSIEKLLAALSTRQIAQVAQRERQETAKAQRKLLASGALGTANGTANGSTGGGTGTGAAPAPGTAGTPPRRAPPPRWPPSPRPAPTSPPATAPEWRPRRPGGARSPTRSARSASRTSGAPRGRTPSTARG
ncbi:hypothetical protein SVIO_071820 [Streptomyces violaceusniger]|uniref:Uncharacterized protein n=1 Tax=Streptomyces violaceusniger TaxID=68280 RepID=A0A4D4LF68_STRVO|nr:hypothetical protein SVIO_071820 [Streptomyces violaceusniger]